MGALEREARRHDLAEEARQRLARTAVRDCRSFTRRSTCASRSGRYAWPAFSVPIARASARALVQALEDAVVERVDAPRAGARSRRAAACRSWRAIRARAATLRIDSTPGMRAMRATTCGSAALSTSTSVYAISPLRFVQHVVDVEPGLRHRGRNLAQHVGHVGVGDARRGYGDSRAISTSGKLTALRILPCSRKSRSWSATMSAQLSSASAVDAPRCGSATTPAGPAERGAREIADVALQPLGRQRRQHGVARRRCRRARS